MAGSDRLRYLPTHLVRSSPFRLFAADGLIGMAAIGAASLLGSPRAGESEAMEDVRGRTDLVAETVVELQLSAALLDGDAEAIGRLDRGTVRLRSSMPAPSAPAPSARARDGADR